MYVRALDSQEALRDIRMTKGHQDRLNCAARRAYKDPRTRKRVQQISSGEVVKNLWDVEYRKMRPGLSPSFVLHAHDLLCRHPQPI